MARTKIILMGDPIVTEDQIADEALIPGHLLELTATGYKKNTANAANGIRTYALERDEMGKGIATTSGGPAGSANYAASDVVKVADCAPGDRVYAWLASGHNVVKGAFLTGNNAGLLSLTGVAADIRCAQALEAVDTSGSAPVAGTRIRVKVC